MKKLYSVILKHILMITVICVFFLVWVYITTPDYPSIRNGFLDLTQWNPESDGRMTLTGDWEFNWGELLTYEDYEKGSPSSPVYVKVPQIWNRYQVDGKRLPGYGFATYHLKVKVPETQTNLGFRMNTASTAYRLYINNRLLAQSGEVGTSKTSSKPHWIPVIAFFKPPAQEFDVIIQVSNYSYARGGLWTDIDFGTENQIQRYESYLKYRDGFIVGILAIMSVYFFCYFYMLREDRKNLSFMLMCLILIVRTSLYGDCLIVRIFPDISFRLLVWIIYLTLIWFPIIFCQLIEFYINDSGRSFIKPFYIYGAAISVIIAIAPVSFYTQWTAAIDLMAIFIFTTAIVKAFFTHMKTIPGANLIMPGSTIIGITGLHDMLYQAHFIRSTVVEFTPVGLIILMMMLFIQMADRTSRTYHEIQSLTRELTEKLKLERDLTERLYALDQLKDEFLTNTSYELRIPLNGIINITQSVLLGIGGQINEIQRQNLNVVVNSAKKLHIIINDLLDVSLVRSGGIRVNPMPLDIQTLVSNMLIIFQHLNKNKNLVLCNEIPPDFPPILADEVRIRQILNNILGNALKFTDSGSVTISACHDGEVARICIEDTGIGITQGKLDNIFNSYEQIDGTLQRNENTGLGLYITRQLVELHGGNIWITSEPGKGSQVYFTIPLSPDHEVSSTATEITREETGSALAFLELKKDELPYSILVADDDLPSMQALINILHLANFRVRGVRSGKEALSTIENGAFFELIILDVMLPELSGFEVLEAIRKKYNRLELPVLMLTSKIQSDDMSLCFKLGANDYLSKPFEAEELLARVNSLVRLKKAVNKLINTEMSFLQAQIKPHFIQNALSVISSLCVKNPHKAKALILDLSEYLRGSFDVNNDEGLTSLSKELELVQAYLSIEQARFKERLQIYYSLLPDIDCTLPLLTIQPLVENAIRHGIMCRMEGGEIHIVTSLEADRIRIEVKDNGIGMEQERINKFYELKQDQRGVGMSNIHRRLITHYGEGLHIDSAPGQGTSVYFFVPYHLGKAAGK